MTFFRHSLSAMLVIYQCCLFSVGKSKTSEDIFTPLFGPRPIEAGKSLSGIGSDMKYTQMIREAIPDLLEKLECKTMLDLPCGDFFWMKTVDLPVEQYIGADCIKKLIERHQREHSAPNRSFIVLDALNDNIPQVDLVLCRDMLIHFSIADIKRFITNLKRSGSHYLLTSQFTGYHENRDIKSGGFRPINLTLAPLNFPQPLHLMEEDMQFAIYPDRTLALWEISELPDYGNHL